MKINYSELTFIRKLGSGKFGKVKLASCRGTLVAVKKLKRSVLTEEELANFKREIEIMKKTHHDNIVQFMGICYDKDNNPMLVTQYLSKGSLGDILFDESIPLSFLERLGMALDIARGMAWIHAVGLVHRDLKPDNLLITQGCHIKICDFGFSEHLPEGKEYFEEQQHVGTPYYMAPELFLRDDANEKSDVYSFGIILWNLITRKTPFPGIANYGQLVNYVTSDLRMEIPSTTPNSVRELIISCWATKPDDRPPFVDVVEMLEHRILPNVRKEILSSQTTNLIADPTGALFWASHFGDGVKSVPWDQFILELNTLIDTMQYLPKNPTPQQIELANEAQLDEYATRSILSEEVVEQERLRRNISGQKNEELYFARLQFFRDCLREMLGMLNYWIFFWSPFNISEEVGGSNEVHMEQFGKVLNWFGPFQEDGHVMFHMNILDLVQKEYFHGFISTRAAEHLLVSRETGLFLLRCSSIPGAFTISSAQPDGVLHVRISRTETGYVVKYNGTEYSAETVQNIVEKLQNLKLQCNGSVFSRIRHGNLREKYQYSQ